MYQSDLSISDFIESMSSVLDVIWEIDVDGCQIFVWQDKMIEESNHQIYDFKKLTSQFCSQYIYKPDRKIWSHYFSMDVLKGNGVSRESKEQFEIRIVDDANGFIWYEAILLRIPGKDGSSGKVLFYLRNINKYKQANFVETAVQSEYDYVVYLEAELNSYVMYSSNSNTGTPVPPVYCHDYDGEVVRYNKEFCEDSEWERISQLMQRNYVLQQMETMGEHIIYCKAKDNGEIRDKKLRFSYYDKDRKILLLTRTDITEIRQEKRQKELLQDALHAANVANKAKSEFLSRMSHDIRTPMNAIIGLTAIAGAYVDDRERVLDCLQKMTGASRMLLGLINEVLDMSKIESGRITLSEEEFELSSLFEGLITVIQPDISKKGHTLDIHIKDIKNEIIIGDAQRLQQVFINILSNAIKYTPAKGRILIEIKQKASNLKGYGSFEFIFQDTGIGMKQEFLNRIFDPFERADEESIRTIQGTGLGMAISKNIVHMMEGDILVESKIGEGSRFTVIVQLKLQQTPEQDVHALIDLPVLIVDDDPVVCENTCICLDDLGMKCQWVLSGKEALCRIEEAHEEGSDFFAAIIDLQMPGIDGIETTRQIRRRVGPHVPVIIISAYDCAEYEIEAQQAGADGFISKPLFKSKLIYLLKKFVLKEKQEFLPFISKLEKADFHQKRILLVEDNELNMEIATEIIGNTGVEIETAENGKEAVEKVAASSNGYYDLIFMDIQMPFMNGYDATKAIRRMKRQDTSTVPIIAMTANAFVEDIQFAKQAGMNQHMAKPIDVSRLLTIMERWLG